jgi:hypothetical protein
VGYTVQARDLTEQYRSYGRIMSDYRAVPGLTYNPGMICGLAAQDQQIYPDQATATPASQNVAFQMRLLGCVAEDWPGFATPGPGLSYTNIGPAATPSVRGSQGVLLVVRGFHPAITISTGGGTPNVVDGTILVPGNTRGNSWGAVAIGARGINDGVTAIAMMPKTGPITSIPAGAGTFTQASRVVTIVGGSLGDIMGVTLTLPNGETQTYQIPVGSYGFAASQPGFSLRQGLQADAWFNKYFNVTTATGTQITITTGGGQMLVPYTTKYGTTADFQITLSGAIGNLVGISVFKLGPGGTSISVPGANFVNGLLYQGTVPGFIIGGLC